MSDLNQDYRPNDWKNVVGQRTAVESMAKLIKSKGKQSFLLYGPSGVGKTTMARIAAKEFGCDMASILDIDAATHTGVENMRTVQDVLRYKPILGDGNNRAIIVDECHRLSGQAWDSLLKSIEEPPPHVVWFFCTTNVSKVPNTVKTRSAKFELKPISDKDLKQLVEDIAYDEGIKLSAEVVSIIVAEAKGSAREALNNLEVCRDAKTRRQAADLLRAALESDATIELCRFLARPGSWKTCMTIVEKLKGENPEGVRRIICAYAGKALKGANDKNGACFWLSVLDAFAQPIESEWELLLGIGRCVYGGD